MFKSIVLDDGKEYVITSKVEYNGGKYFFITDIDDPKNYKFVELESEDVISVINSDEQELLRNLILLFGLDVKKTLTELNINIDE